jgi:hypothetical protein
VAWTTRVACHSVTCTQASASKVCGIFARLQQAEPGDPLGVVHRRVEPRQRLDQRHEVVGGQYLPTVDRRRFEHVSRVVARSGLCNSGEPENYWWTTFLGRVRPQAEARDYARVASRAVRRHRSPSIERHPPRRAEIRCTQPPTRGYDHSRRRRSGAPASAGPRTAQPPMTTAQRMPSAGNAPEVRRLISGR